MLNMFEVAKAQPVKAAAKSKGKTKDEVVLEGLEDVAVLDALIKSLTGLKDSLRGPVNDQMREIFIDGSENFLAVEGDASASAELRKRATTSPLTTEEVEALKADDIVVGEIERTPERFVINPAYADNSVLLEKVSKALAKVAGMPNDFVQFQAGVKVPVVTDETFEAVMGDKELAAKYIDTVGVLALKPKLENADLAFMVEKAKKLLGLADSKSKKKGK